LLISFLHSYSLSSATQSYLCAEVIERRLKVE